MILPFKTRRPGVTPGVVLTANVGRIDIEEHTRPLVLCHHLREVSTIQLHIAKSLRDRFKERERILIRARLILASTCAPAIGTRPNTRRKATAQDIEPAHRTLQGV